MDIAIVGDHYVQISEMGRDGRLRNIARKTDFGSRIRNAQVIGASPESAAEDEKDEDFTRIKIEDDDAIIDCGESGSDDSDDNDDSDEYMEGTSSRRPGRRSGRRAPARRLPPQQLLVVLESGDCIFLFIDPESGDKPELTGAKGRKMEAGSHRSDDAAGSYFSTPDRVFGTSGRGVTGAVTEFRYGLRADIGLEVDYPTPIKQSWIFATRTDTFDIEYHVLVSLVDRTEAFQMSSDLAQVGIYEDGVKLYDLESRTLAAAQISEDVILQVTENYIVFYNPESR
ncbi:hypothetical protein SEUCBS140593_002625 [Sporothrix eucalyptigena]|uniref:Uncharacterized protein n=1 Tax=Sporothrix eucalyptigena TaxID=1812306 RepID=A0ABP0B873_9PEZI